ncbi:hypothetical protein N8529_00785 [bacterium]|nr:hypothetical protein [bacterium]
MDMFEPPNPQGDGMTRRNVPEDDGNGREISGVMNVMLVRTPHVTGGVRLVVALT